MAQHLAERLTLPGRLLLVLTIVLAVGGSIGYVALGWDDLPAGSYPLWFFVLPVLVGALLFFALGVVILRWIGVGIWREVPKSDED